MLNDMKLSAGIAFSNKSADPSADRAPINSLKSTATPSTISHGGMLYNNMISPIAPAMLNPIIPRRNIPSAIESSQSESFKARSLKSDSL